MSVQEMQAELLKLSPKNRAEVATALLNSLPPVLLDDDEGIAEAKRRDSEMDIDPSSTISYKKFLAAFDR